MKEDIMSEVKVYDEVEAMVIDEAVILTTKNPIMEEEKAYQRKRKRQSKIEV